MNGTLEWGKDYWVLSSTGTFTRPRLIRARVTEMSTHGGVIWSPPPVGTVLQAFETELEARRARHTLLVEQREKLPEEVMRRLDELEAHVSYLRTAVRRLTDIAEQTRERANAIADHLGVDR